MNFSKLVYLINGLVLSVGLSVSTAVWAAGTPSALIISSTSDVAAIALNFSDDYTLEEVNEFHSLVALVYGVLGAEDLLGAGGTIDLYSPEQVIALGYDGDSLHNLAVSALSGLKSYTQIKVSKFVPPKSVATYHIFDIWSWSPGDTAGFYIGDVILPDLDKLPLAAVLDVMGVGSRYINIVTAEPFNNGIADVLHLDFYYMESNTAERVFVAGIEISAASIQSIFNAVLGGDLMLSP